MIELSPGTYTFEVQYKTDIEVPSTALHPYKIKSLQIISISATILIQRRRNTDFVFSTANPMPDFDIYPSNFGTHTFTLIKSTTILFIHNYVGPMGAKHQLCRVKI